MDTPSYRPEPHQLLARRVRDSRRARRPLMQQSEAAALFDLSQSAYSRLENGETTRWSKRAREGAAKLLQTTVERIDAALAGDDISTTRLMDLQDRLEEIAAETSDNAAMLREILSTTSAGHAEFGVLVRAKRMSKGWTLFDAAELIGINPLTLNRIEQGAASMIVYAVQLAAFLGINPEAITMYCAAIDSEDQAAAIADVRLRIDAAERDLAIGAGTLATIDVLLERVGTDAEVES